MKPVALPPGRAKLSTIHRLINDGIIAGEQITPGMPRKNRRGSANEQGRPRVWG
jgi:hypothetical protein